MRNNYRLSMNFKIFDFKAFKEELKTGVVKFYLKYNKYKSIVDELKKSKNNIAYIYAFNIPKFNGRYVMKTDIVEVKKCNKKIDGETYDIELNVKVINVYNSKSPNELTPFKIRKILGKNVSFQGTISRIDDKISNYLDGNTSDKEKLMISTNIDDFLNNYVNSDCSLKDIKIKKTSNKNHDTFIEENGTEYIEWHHFIFRSKMKGKENKQKIDINCNLISLCPRCHRMIHYGNQETKKQMIDGILVKLKEKNEYKHLAELFNEIKKDLEDYTNERNLEDYLYKIYNVKKNTND